MIYLASILVVFFVFNLCLCQVEPLGSVISLECGSVTVGVLGTGFPRLACLRCGSRGGPAWPIFVGARLKTLTRGQASQGGRHEASSGAASPGRLARRCVLVLGGVLGEESIRPLYGGGEPYL